MPSLTIMYKKGFIHVSDLLGPETIRVSVDRWAFAHEVKSVQAAKLKITAHLKKYGESKIKRGKDDEKSI